MPPFSDRIWNGPYGWDQASFDGQQEYTDFRWANSEYFKAMGTRLLAGTAVRRQRVGLGRPTSIVIDAELARKAWPGQDPIGKRVIWGEEVLGADRREGRVIGVVEHQKKSNVGMQSREAIYFPRKVLLGGGFVVRASDPQTTRGRRSGDDAIHGAGAHAPPDGDAGRAAAPLDGADARSCSP